MYYGDSINNYIVVLPMAKMHEISEQFMSLEGEATFSNHPTVYIRFSRCNFTCPHFNNPNHEVDDKNYAPLGFNPKDFITLKELPLITKGCDSQYSVNPQFSHMWEKLSTDELCQRVVDLLPHKSWVHPVTNLPVILSLTGGEPLLQWKFLPDIMNHPLIKDCRHILVETNCTVPFKEQFIQDIRQWLADDHNRQWTWSNSPKISSSGETWKEAIKPEVAVMQRGTMRYNSLQYFKFVVRPLKEDFDEVMKAMNEYYEAGIPRDVQIWAMPMACTEEQQDEICAKVAKMCMEYGFLYSHRIQNSLWGNGVGT